MNRYIKIILITIACTSIPLLSWSGANSKAYGTKKKPTIITYKETGKGKLRLHIFPPVNPKENTNTSAIVFCFGGGWTHGSPTQFYPQCQYFASRDILAVSIEYRIKNKHGSSPHHSLKDAKSAIRWIRKNANKLHINPNKIIASGGSAGGHLAACTAIIEEFDEPEEDLSISSKPNAVVLFNPMLGLEEEGWGSESLNERTRRVSPMQHIKNDLPPFIIFHGTADKTIPFETIENFSKLMKDAGNICELIPFEDKGHGFFNYEKNDGKEFKEIITLADKFLVAHGFLKEKAEKEKTD